MRLNAKGGHTWIFMRIAISKMPTNTTESTFLHILVTIIITSWRESLRMAVVDKRHKKDGNGFFEKLILLGLFQATGT
jgi:hypothetical protein